MQIDTALARGGPGINASASGRLASVPQVEHQTLGMDEDHASAGSRSVPASLLHLRKAKATGSLSPSMQLGTRRSVERRFRYRCSYVKRLRV
jgi:hypothetical protein